MKRYEIWQEDTIVAGQVGLAESFGSRLKGLMFRKSLEPGEGLLLLNCPDIHCCFMRFTIDVIYLDPGYRILAVETVKPWHLGRHHRGVAHVLELEQGCGADLCPGMKLSLREAACEASSKHEVRDFECGSE